MRERERDLNNNSVVVVERTIERRTEQVWKEKVVNKDKKEWPIYHADIDCIMAGVVVTSS